MCGEAVPLHRAATRTTFSACPSREVVNGFDGGGHRVAAVGYGDAGGLIWGRHGRASRAVLRQSAERLQIAEASCRVQRRGAFGPLTAAEGLAAADCCNRRGGSFGSAPSESCPASRQGGAGARKSRHSLSRGTGAEQIPAPSTITDILRCGRLLVRVTPIPEPLEAKAAKLLWQMDFKVHIALDGRTAGKDERCWPLAVLDDHSRHLLGMQACAAERC
jgi:hypothetical protein